MKTKYRVQEQETLGIIKAVVCDVYQVTTDDIIGKKRGDIATPRHVCLALGYAFTKNSQTAVGAYFGGKDHAMVNYSVNTMLAQYETYETYKETIDKIIKMVSLMSAITFTVEDIKRAAARNKSKAARRPCLTDMLNERILVILRGKATKKDIEDAGKIFSVLEKEAAA